MKDLQNDFGMKDYRFTVKGKILELNASEYEAWLQVYNTPQKALEQYAGYNSLKHKVQSKQSTDAEDKEFLKLDRVMT